VEVTKPPITAIAIGARNDAPSPKAIAIGNSDNIVVKLVIIIGRILCAAATTIASASFE
jgi:hypothetical protein